ncbi:MAG: phosphotransferase family protein [Alphaproteobacteria bacterium]|nr:phosphotransferase family protein [Alphaproteobacteria bacterium]MBV9151873.1 phosphotransferase family protein [Alphaproteobacteria bacterium]
MAATPLPPFDRPAVARFLAEASGASSVELSEPQLLPGGAIQENLGIEAKFSGGRLGGWQRLVLRTDAATGVPSSLPRLDEFAVLRAVFAAGVTVPEPLLACADPNVIGRPFFIMRRLAGTAQGRIITADPAFEPGLPRIAARLGEELARLQTIRPPRPDLAFLAPPAANSAFEQIAGFRAYLDRHPNPRPVLEWAIRWLETNVPPPLPPVLCHRDFRTGNYMLDTSSGGAWLTGVLDWEFAGWGEPDEDIGWFCCKGWRFARLDREAGGIADRAPFYAAYEAAAGRRLDPERIRYWEIFANVRWAIIALQQSDRYLVGGARDLSTAIIGRRAGECELELLLLLDPPGSPAKAPSPRLGEWVGARGHSTAHRDLPSGAELAELGRRLLIEELLPLLPPERHREVHLIATAIGIAGRETAAGEAPFQAIFRSLAQFYAHAPTPTLPLERGREFSPDRGPAKPSPASGGGRPAATEAGGWGPSQEEEADSSLLRRFARDLRNGAFESSPSQESAARAILWRLTIARLREANPQFLAAHGLE